MLNSIDVWIQDSDDSDDSDEEDDTAELLAELNKIKKERAAEKTFKVISSPT